RLALVPPGPPDDPSRARVGARVLVRLDVRISDARARHALPVGKLAPADVSTRRAAADELRCRARGPVGDLRIGLQRARPGSDLPVFELRRPGSGSPAGSR